LALDVMCSYVPWRSEQQRNAFIRASRAERCLATNRIQKEALFTYPHAVPNLYDFHSFMEPKVRSIKEWGLRFSSKSQY